MIAEWIAARRWFRGKARGLASASIVERFPLALGSHAVTLAVVRCVLGDGSVEDYVVPIATTTREEGERLLGSAPHLVIGFEGEVALCDALGDPRTLAELVPLFEGRRIEGSGGTLVFRSLPAFASAARGDLTPRPVPLEQTNTSVPFGRALILKIVRRLEPGRSVELEMGEHLTACGLEGVPEVLGAIEIERPGLAPSTVGVIHRFVDNQGDAFTFALQEIGRDPSPEAFAPHAARLGERLGAMHVVLARAGEDTPAAFLPKTIDAAGRARLAEDVRAHVAEVSAWLGPEDRPRIEARIAAFLALSENPIATRVHGDLHLGQILVAAGDFVLIDFEGEPARPLAARKAKRSPLVDVAGMLRSFDYAAATALRARSIDDARAWSSGAARAFVHAYQATVRTSPLLARCLTTFDEALGFFLLEKCLYEIAYEANNRPAWLAIPQGGLADLLSRGSP